MLLLLMMVAYKLESIDKKLELYVDDYGCNDDEVRLQIFKVGNVYCNLEGNMLQMIHNGKSEEFKQGGCYKKDRFQENLGLSFMHIGGDSNECIDGIAMFNWKWSEDSTSELATPSESPSASASQSSSLWPTQSEIPTKTLEASRSPKITPTCSMSPSESPTQSLRPSMTSRPIEITKSHATPSRSFSQSKVLKDSRDFTDSFTFTIGRRITFFSTSVKSDFESVKSEVTVIPSIQPTTSKNIDTISREINKKLTLGEIMLIAIGGSLSLCVVL